MADLNAAGRTPISVQAREQDGMPVIGVAGELDLTNTKQVAAVFESVLSGHDRKVVFEVGDLTFMDSSGIALFVSVARQVQEVELRDPGPVVRRLIDVTGLGKVLRMTP